MCSPAAAVGYAIGRIGCLLSGDGDYGVPTTLPWGMSFPNGVVPTVERVHPTPLYEFFIWLAIGAILWRLGKRALTGAGPKGEVFCAYLILTGIARFLIEFIRINPRSFFGLSNAQTASLVSIVAGAILLWGIRGRSHHLAGGLAEAILLRAFQLSFQSGLEDLPSRRFNDPAVHQSHLSLIFFTHPAYSP
jgi:phosphatidylglycerol:prolipoprotein diacylglycerol transferase